MVTDLECGGNVAPLSNSCSFESETISPLTRSVPDWGSTGNKALSGDAASTILPFVPPEILELERSKKG